MNAPEKDKDIPIISPEQLSQYDGILLGIPTRYGMAAAQMKAFWDATGSLWSQGQLHGKLGGLFFSTGSQNGGQESTALTWMTQYAHHGIIYVPMGYRHGGMFEMNTPRGGSAWGPGTIAVSTRVSRPVAELIVSDVGGRWQSIPQ